MTQLKKHANSLNCTPKLPGGPSQRGIIVQADYCIALQPYQYLTAEFFQYTRFLFVYLTGPDSK